MAHERDIGPDAILRASTLNDLNPNQMLRFEDWIRLTGIEPEVGRKLWNSDKGPRLLRITSHTVRVLVGDAIKWSDKIKEKEICSGDLAAKVKAMTKKPTMADLRAAYDALRELGINV